MGDAIANQRCQMFSEHKKNNKNKTLENRIERFIHYNARMREKTLASEQAFLKKAGNISSAQLHVLLSIGENPECTISALAKQLQFSKSNMTQMIDKLIKNSFVRKRKNKLDKRIVDIILLEKGKKICAAHQAHVVRVAKGWFEVMSEDEQMLFLETWKKYLEST